MIILDKNYLRIKKQYNIIRQIKSMRKTALTESECSDFQIINLK